MKSDDYIVEFKNVSKFYDDKQVLSNVSFKLKRGENLGIIGGSGSGKTTILKILLNLTEAEEGEVYLFSRNIKEISKKEIDRLRQRTGMVFQSGALFDSMTVWENIAMPLLEDIEKERKITDDDIRKIHNRVMELLKLLELDGTENMLPSELSGGMMRRVAIARALVKSPELLIYDEPTVGLDPITADRVTRYIKRLQERLKVSSIVVTHDLRFALQVTNRIIMLQKGRMVFSGTTEEFLRSDNEMVIQFREAGLAEIK